MEERLNRRSRSGVVLLLIAFASLVGCGSEVGTDQHSGSLVGQSFVSTSGDPQDLVADAEVALTFEQREDTTLLRWQAGCNTFGAHLDVEPKRLVVGEVSGTEIGCPDPRHRQDVRLLGFFGSDPEWELAGDRLRLSSSGAVLELTRTDP